MMSGGAHLDNIIANLYKNKKFIKRGPDTIKELYYFLLDELEKIESPNSEPKAVIHGEFTYEHVLFDGNRVYKVIDWDLVNKTYRFLDIGVTMTFIYLDTKSYEHVKKFLEGYNSVNSLTRWERENIDKIYLIGLGVYLWWVLDDIKSGILKWKDIRYDTFDLYGNIKKLCKFS